MHLWMGLFAIQQLMHSKKSNLIIDNYNNDDDLNGKYFLECPLSHPKRISPLNAHNNEILSLNSLNWFNYCLDDTSEHDQEVRKLVQAKKSASIAIWNLKKL